MEDNQKLEQELHEAEHATDDLLKESAKKEDLSKLRWGTNRWFILLFIILGFIGARYYPPILPHIQLPAEKYPGGPCRDGSAAQNRRHSHRRDKTKR